jgi:ABC-type phosphate transport system permease subunit
MSIASTTSFPVSTAAPVARARRRTSLAARGEPMVWLTGGCVAAAVLMIIGLLAYIVFEGFSTFWPQPLVQVTVKEGDVTKVVVGEPARHDVYVYSQQVPIAEDIKSIPGMSASVVKADEKDGYKTVRFEIPRTLYKTGNFDLTGEDFTWVEDRNIIGTERPEWGLVVERTAWGNAYGTLESVTVNGQTTTGADAAWAKFNEVHGSMLALADQVRDVEKDEMGDVSREQDDIRLELAGVRRTHGEGSPEYTATVERVAQRQRELDGRMNVLRSEVKALRDRMATATIAVRAPTGQIIPADRANPDGPMLVAQVVRTYPANTLSFFAKLKVYVGRWVEFLFGEPREANTEGGVWPAIVGTILLTFVMVIFVVPVGVIAALYLREYAKQGPLVSFVRISVNNLAGVPSIVYGVFGLGFFCYIVGGYLDSGPGKGALHSGPWAGLVLATVVVIGIGAGLTFFFSLFTREKDRGLPGTLFKIGLFVVWLVAAGMVVAIAWTTPFFHGFFETRAAEGSPTLGKSAMIWASMTLAILTLPLVIVATEEALAAVPRSMREGSYACGASKWQTIRKIVLPRAMPGVMTGMILAIARGAGEVAPIMLVGAVKLAPELPISWRPSEMFGVNRSFMHLGFHIFDLAFQSRNSMAALPMAYTTTFLLIVIVVLLNVAAIFIRSRLRKAYAGGAF